MPSISLGCMNFGNRTDENEARKIMARALERGVAHFDVANMYVDGESERIVGRFVRGLQSPPAIATKCGILQRGGKREGLSAPAIRRAFDESRERLGLERIDLYYFHSPDPSTPIEESLAAVAELVRSGGVARFGVSNYAAWQILEIDQLSSAHGWPRPQVSQLLYNLLVRQLDVEYWKFTRRHPIHTTVFNALAGGLLGREVRRGDAPPAGSRFEKNPIYRRRYFTDRMVGLVEAYRALAADAGIGLVDLAYAWLAGRAGVDSILVGAATVAHLDAAIEGCEKKLSDFAGTDASYAR